MEGGGGGGGGGSMTKHGGRTATAVANHLHPFKKLPGGEEGEMRICVHKCVSVGTTRRGLWRG